MVWHLGARLLTVAVVMLFFASQGHARTGVVASGCCYGGQMRKVEDIQQCFEQKQSNCPHYYLLQTSAGKEICVKPNAPWLKKLLQAGDLTCRPIAEGRFEVLDKYDMEW